MATGVIALLLLVVTLPAGEAAGAVGSGGTGTDSDDATDRPSIATGPQGPNMGVLHPQSGPRVAMTVAAGEIAIAANGKCSLREAIINANNDDQTYADCPAGSGHDVITLPPGQYRLSSEPGGQLPEITTAMTITGGDSRPVLDADFLSRHFSVALSGDLTLVNVAMWDGFASDDVGGSIVNRGKVQLEDVHIELSAAGWGGAIWNGGDLAIDDSRITAAVAELVGGGVLNNAGATLDITDTVIEQSVGTNGGGAIYNDGDVHIVHSTLGGNRSEGWGGGLINEEGGTVLVEDSLIIDNEAEDGGGIMNGGTLTLRDSIVANNHAIAPSLIKGGRGGGLFNLRSGASATIDRSAITGNIADNHGGGVFSYLDARIELTNSTVSANRSFTDGALWNSDGRLTVLNSTVVGNSSEVGAVFASFGDDVIVNTLIAKNGTNCDGSYETSSHNLTDDDSCGPGFRQVTNVGLGPLADNGGVTVTHAVQDGSPAIDAGDQQTCTALDGIWDQRGPGFFRTSGQACDIGAFELQVETDYEFRLPLPQVARDAGP